MQWFLMYRHGNKDKKLVFFVHASQIKTEIHKAVIFGEQSLKENPWRIKPASRHESLLIKVAPLSYTPSNYTLRYGRICPIGGYIMVCRFFCVHKITLLSVFISKKWVGPFAWFPVYLLCLIKEKINSIIISITVSAYH